MTTIPAESLNALGQVFIAFIELAYLPRSEGPPTDDARLATDFAEACAEFAELVDDREDLASSVESGLAAMIAADDDELLRAAVATRMAFPSQDPAHIRTFCQMLQHAAFGSRGA